MAPRRDPKPDAARAARRSAKGPHSPPPVTGCLWCKKLSEMRRRLRALQLRDDVRTAAALSGVPMTLSPDDFDRIYRERCSGAAEQIVRVPLDVIQGKVQGAQAGDLLRAHAMLMDRLSGPVEQRHKHSGAVATVVQFVSGLPQRDSAPAADAQPTPEDPGA